jgi:hypothetical protein
MAAFGCIWFEGAPGRGLLCEQYVIPGEIIQLILPTKHFIYFIFFVLGGNAKVLIRK